MCKEIANFPGVMRYYDWLRGRSRNTLMACNTREICMMMIIKTLNLIGVTFLDK